MVVVMVERKLQMKSEIESAQRQHIFRARTFQIASCYRASANLLVRFALYRV